MMFNHVLTRKEVMSAYECIFKSSFFIASVESSEGLRGFYISDVSAVCAGGVVRCGAVRCAWRRD